MNRDDSFRILRETHRLGGTLSSLADVHLEPVDDDASEGDHQSYAATWYDAEEGPQAVVIDATTSQSHPVAAVGHPQLTASERQAAVEIARQVDEVVSYLRERPDNALVRLKPDPYSRLALVFLRPDDDTRVLVTVDLGERRVLDTHEVDLR